MQIFQSFTGKGFSCFQRFLHDLAAKQHGSTAVEYALMVGVLSGIMIASIKAIGNSSAGTLNQIAESLAESRDNAPQASEWVPPPPSFIQAPVQVKN